MSEIPLLKYKRVSTAVEKLGEALKVLKSTKELNESKIESLEEDITWLMDEHSEKFRDEKKDTIRKGLKNLKCDRKGKTALGVVKIVRRELRMGLD